MLRQKLWMNLIVLEECSIDSLYRHLVLPTPVICDEFYRMSRELRKTSYNNYLITIELVPCNMLYVVTADRVVACRRLGFHSVVNAFSKETKFRLLNVKRIEFRMYT